MASKTGHVKWFNEQKGFGFITPDDNSGDVFVHANAIKSQGLRALQENQRVEFNVVKGPKGLQAEEVEVIE